MANCGLPIALLTVPRPPKTTLTVYDNCEICQNKGLGKILIADHALGGGAGGGSDVKQPVTTTATATTVANGNGWSTSEVDFVTQRTGRVFLRAQNSTFTSKGVVCAVGPNTVLTAAHVVVEKKSAKSYPYTDMMLLIHQKLYRVVDVKSPPATKEGEAEAPDVAALTIEPALPAGQWFACAAPVINFCSDVWAVGYVPASDSATAKYHGTLAFDSETLSFPEEAKECLDAIGGLRPFVQHSQVTCVARFGRVTANYWGCRGTSGSAILRRVMTTDKPASASASAPSSASDPFVLVGVHTEQLWAHHNDVTLAIGDLLTVETLSEQAEAAKAQAKAQGKAQGKAQAKKGAASSSTAAAAPSAESRNRSDTADSNLSFDGSDHHEKGALCVFQSFDNGEVVTLVPLGVKKNGLQRGVELLLALYNNSDTDTDSDDV